LGNVTMSFIFKPTQIGSQNAVVTLKGSNQNVPTANTNIVYTFALNGVGAEPPVVTLDPVTATFDNVALGDTRNGSFTIGNTGKYPLKYYIPGISNSNVTVSDRYVHKYGYAYKADTINAQNSYDWVDISATGQNFKSFFVTNASERYAAAVLPFKFPFMGTQFDTIFIAKTGLIGFENKGSYTNTSLLNITQTGYLPNRFIAPLAKGGNEGSLLVSGNIYYKKFPDRVIIQWSDISSATAGMNLTFQAILFDDGNIKFNYKVLPARTVTNFWKYVFIGIGNSVDVDYLVIHSGRDNKAPLYYYLETKNIPSNMSSIAVENPGLGIISSIDKPTGIVYAGQSFTVNYTIATDNLWEGAIKQKVNVVSNDPSNPVKSHDITVNITSGGVNNLEFDQTELNFGDVMQTGMKTATLSVKNKGSKNTLITGYELNNANFEIIESYTELKVGRTLPIVLKVNSADLGTKTGILTVKTDIAGDFTFNLNANVVDKSGIVSNITDITKTLASGETFATQVTIENNGAADLDFTVAGNQWLNVSQPSGLTAKANTDDYIMVSNFQNTNNAPTFDWTEISGISENFVDSVQDPKGPIYYGIKLPWSFTFYGNTYDSIYVNYQGVITFTNKKQISFFFGPQYPFPSPEELDNQIAVLHSYMFPQYQNPVAGLYFKAFDDRVILELKDYQDGWAMANPISMQTVLFKNGEIKFLYSGKTPDVLARQGTAGIENAMVQKELCTQIGQLDLFLTKR